MSDSSSTRFICIHGHFYQPPRENPWLGAIEREDSAAPYHDWNERINLECYRANTAARLVDDKNRILDLRNNYRRLSFNFGPTLLEWLEQKDPWVYRAILDADGDSLQKQDGHGNAIAQVYNHIIMPLADPRDKVTQVLWGIRDFETRFGRRPEGMWLAETAVDRATLSVLADAGIKFTILSPYQAGRWRFLKESQWRSADGGSIPTGRAYRYHCGGGKYIHLFFYDADIARGIAFERLLEHSSKLLGQIGRSYSARPDSSGPWLVHTATDGESYGHHFKFGDMALAAALQELERDPATRIVNYGNFLASFPVTAEVEIIEGSAWSCAHGLGRWSEDCGCHIGGGPEWTQKWRGPLRRALNDLRDALASHYQKRAAKLCRDPWKARNSYIDVVLARQKNLEAFLAEHLISGPESKEVPLFLDLLEMQRFSLLMFTSCGWFFDEISQLESTLILKYAGRAMQLADRTGAPDFRPQFLKTLQQAPSNLPEFGNGSRVFLKKVQPEIVEEERVAANYAIRLLARSPQIRYRIYDYSILPQKEEDLGSKPIPCLYGHLRVRSDTTLEEKELVYAVIHFGALDFRCSVKPYTGEEEYRSILEALQCSVEKQDTVKMVRILDEKFGPQYFSLHDVFRDLRDEIALEISRKTLATYTDLQRSLYQIYKPLLSSLCQWGIRVPSDLRVGVRRILSDDLHQVVVDVVAHEQEKEGGSLPWDYTDFFFRAHLARIETLLGEARSWGVALELERTSVELGRSVVQSASELIATFDPDAAGRFFRLLTVCKALELRPENWKVQTLYHRFVTEGVQTPERFGRIKNVAGLLNELDNLLACTFAPLLDAIPVSLSRDIVPVTGSRAVISL